VKKDDPIAFLQTVHTNASIVLYTNSRDTKQKTYAHTTYNADIHTQKQILRNVQGKRAE
jgi:hypothetical protein